MYPAQEAHGERADFMLFMYLRALKEVNEALVVTDQGQLKFSSRKPTLLGLIPCEEHTFKLQLAQQETRYIGIGSNQHPCVTNSLGAAALFKATAVSGLDAAYRIALVESPEFLLRADRRQLKLSNSRDASFDIETSFRLINEDRGICRFSTVTVAGATLVNFQRGIKRLSRRSSSETRQQHSTSLDVIGTKLLQPEDASTRPRGSSTEIEDMEDFWRTRCKQAENSLAMLKQEFESRSSQWEEVMKEYMAAKLQLVARESEFQELQIQYDKLRRMLKCFDID